MKKPILIVIIQVFFIAMVVISGGIIPKMPGFIIWMMGVLLGLWALRTMGAQFNIMPNPRNNLRLETKGPYKWIRHPMYCALLLLSLGYIWYRPTPWMITMTAGLLTILIIKVDIEEKLLRKELDDYNEYMEKTKKLIPFFY